MKLAELQKVLSLFNEPPTELQLVIVSRLKELVITRYPHEQGTYQMANFEVSIKLEQERMKMFIPTMLTLVFFLTYAFSKAFREHWERRKNEK